MKCAIVSDIHANLQAWNATLLDIRGQNIDRICCLGDIVGYGPNPAEVLESVHSNVDYLALGNHDAVICDKMDSSLFNEKASTIIEWTRNNLGNNAVKFLKTLPLSVVSEFFRGTHGEFSDPAAFNYIIDPEDAMGSWAAVDENLLFVGHTHQPAIFLLGQSGVPHVVEPQDFVLEEGKRFLVNVGSVGQPRDRQAMACYCIFDTDEQSVSWRQIPFDIDAYRESLSKAGLPEEASEFLRYDPRAAHAPLRENLNFKPASTPDEAVRDTLEVQELDILQKKVTRWKTFTAAGLLSLIILAGISFGTYQKHKNRSLILQPTLMSVIPAPVILNNNNLLRMPSEPVEDKNPVPGWRIELGDADRQSASFGTDTNEIDAFVLRSQTAREDLCLSSPPVNVKEGMRFTAQALFKKSKDFTGDIAVYLVKTQKTDNGTKKDDKFLWKQPVWDYGDGWFMAKKTHKKGIPENAASIRFQIRGNFTGTVLVKDPQLVRKE